MNAQTGIKSVIVAFLVAIALLSVGDQQHASAAASNLITRTFAIGIRHNTRCQVLAGDIYFPSTYVSGQVAPLDVQGSIQVDCDPGRRASIRLDQGLHPAPGSTARNPRRRMADILTGTMFIDYNLYEDAGYSQVWDDFRPGVKTARAWPVTLTVYARMFGGQTVYPGTYRDTVIANMFW